jgi:hypothetical protein
MTDGTGRAKDGRMYRKVERLGTAPGRRRGLLQPTTSSSVPLDSDVHIAGLAIYPIKGCRGVSLSEIEVDRLGPVGDRRLMLVDERNQFLSQREVPELATLVPALDGDRIRVTGCDGAALTLDVDLDGPLRSVSVWAKEGLLAADQGDQAAAWFTRALRLTCRLVAFGPSTINRVDPAYSPRPDAETSFTDGYPIMAVVEESLDDLNRRLTEPVPMQRFRPSVVVSGTAAWSEDDWRVISLGEVICDAVKPCARCVVTTTDQLTGAQHPAQEPLRMLAGFRTIRGMGAIFGQNLVPRNTGILRVGDIVRST